MVPSASVTQWKLHFGPQRPIGERGGPFHYFQRIGTNVYTFEEPGELVTSGLFAISRNPMYLGLVLAGFGAALVSATLAALILSAAFALTVRYWYIAFEESAMLQRFGEPYRAYCRRVRRWLGRHHAEVESNG